MVVLSPPLAKMAYLFKFKNCKRSPEVVGWPITGVHRLCAECLYLHLKIIC